MCGLGKHTGDTREKGGSVLETFLINLRLPANVCGAGSVGGPKDFVGLAPIQGLTTETWRQRR